MNARFSGSALTRWLLIPCAWVLLVASCDPVNGNSGEQPEDEAWVQAALGGRHTCGIQSDGRMWCWGANDQGQLGVGDDSRITAPQFIDLRAEVVDVAAGNAHTCAVLASGEVRCWGANAYGQLGDGTKTSRAVPVEVALPGNAVGVAAGYAHTCAVGAGGQVWCWGSNDTGQLGVGNAFPDSCGTPEVPCSPSPLVVEGLSEVVAVRAGGTAEGSHTCARLENHTVWCWGDNSEEQLGDGTLISRNSPVEIIDLLNVSDVDVGARHCCARQGDGTAYCWGRSFGSPFWISVLENVERVAAGGDFSCGVLSDGSAWCWGANDAGQLGDGTNQDRVIPSQVVALMDVVEVSAGQGHACAVVGLGQLWCWGSNSDGQVHGTSQLSTNLPTRVMP